MNLLSYKNRFKSSTNPDETNGYLFALQDMLDYIKELTDFNPDKRMIDSADIATAIGDTTFALGKLLTDEQRRLQSLANKITGVRLSGYKVDDFLKSTLDEIDQEIEQEFADYKNNPDDLKDINI